MLLLANNEYFMLDLGEFNYKLLWVYRVEVLIVTTLGMGVGGGVLNLKWQLLSICKVNIKESRQAASGVSKPAHY